MRKRHSITIKFFAAIGTIAVVFIGVLLLLNLFFYDDYDLLSRRRELLRCYESVRTSYAQGSDAFFAAMDTVESQSAIRLAIADPDGNIYTSAFSPQQEETSGSDSFDSSDPSDSSTPSDPFSFFEQQLLPQLPPFLYQHPHIPAKEEQRFRGYTVLLTLVSKLDWEALRTGKKYQFLNVFLNGKEQYLCLAGALTDDQCLLAYMPYAFIEQNSSFNLMFLLIAGGCSLLICLIGAFFIARQFTRPLIAMAEVADHMAELDFSNKYQPHSNSADEIHQLGQSLNRLSTYLEQAIGELQQSNEQLAEANEQLEQTNEKLAREVREKERIDGMRQEFIVNVSHELKTPLALIQGYAEGLTAGIADDPEDRKFYCDTIADEANHMNQLVMQLLNLSKLELGKEQTYTDDIDLYALCEEAVQKTAVLCESRHLTVRCLGGEIIIRTDGGMMEQVIMNYLSNAIRYTEDGKTIELCVARTERGARLTVFNEGDGLPEDELPKIWEKFYRTDRARTRENGGTGIGLSLVRAIADTLGGDCGAENVAHGIAFWFDVPEAET